MSSNPLPKLSTLLLGVSLAACDGGGPAGPSAPDCGDGAIRLAVGEAIAVPADEECELRSEAGAEYALAYFDTRLVTGAETVVEPYIPPSEFFTLTVTDVAGGPAQALSAGDADAPIAVPEPDFQWSFAPGAPLQSAWPVGGARPWSVDDEIRIEDPLCTGAACAPKTARVARVVDDWLVLALVDATLSAQSVRVTSLFDEAVPLFRQHTLPLLQAALTPHLPVTSTGSGQLVVVWEGDVSPGGGVANSSVTAAGAATHWIELEWSAGLDLGKMLWLLSHEIAHAFQYEFLARDPPLAGLRSERGGARWGIEGGATLLEYEAIRRAAGRPLTGNLDFRMPPTTELDRYNLRSAEPTLGGIPFGYGPAASFLRDLVLRRAATGEPLEQAFATVSRGATEGWYGHGEAASRRRGLTARMRERIEGWDPGEAVLTWTLSAAGDDRTSNPVYQDPTWLRMGEPDGDGGWGSFRVLQGGSGQTVSGQRPIGTSGWIHLHAPAGGMTFRATAVPSVRWMLLRIG